MKKNPFASIFGSLAAVAAAFAPQGIRTSGKYRASSKMAERLRHDPEYKKLSMQEALEHYKKNMIRASPEEIARWNKVVEEKKKQKIKKKLEKWQTTARSYGKATRIQSNSNQAVT